MLEPVHDPLSPCRGDRERDRLAGLAGRESQERVNAPGREGVDQCRGGAPVSVASGKVSTLGLLERRDS